MIRKALMGTTAFAVAMAAEHCAQAASDKVIDDTFAGAMAGETGQQAAIVTGGNRGFSWSLRALSLQEDPGSIAGQEFSLGYDNTDISIRGKWDNRYQTRGGLSFGATLGEENLQAVGGGFLANEQASELYGQYTFIAPSLDPLSSFTLGEHVAGEDESFTGGDKRVWGYTTYLNWFKRNDGRQSIDADLPPGLRTGLQTLLNNTSALSGTAAYTYSGKTRLGAEGSPQTNALDISLRGVSPTLFGEFLPVSLGVGFNISNYDHIDDTQETEVIGNGGAGITFMGGAYFNHRFHWLVGMGADADTRGVYGATIAAELGSIAVSYRHTSDQQSTVLLSWQVSDLWTAKNPKLSEGQPTDTAFDQLSFASAGAGAGYDGRTAAAASSLTRLGFLPPTGSEMTKPARNGSGTTGGLQLSPSLAAQQPLQVQQAITRTQELHQQVGEQKNSEIRGAANPATRATILGLSLASSVGLGQNNRVWATFTQITNPGLSTFTGLCAGNGATPSVSISGNTIVVDLRFVLFGVGCSSVQVFQDGVSLGSVNGSGCFVAGTGVLMADGSEKPIEDVAVGEWLKGADGQANRVIELHRPLLGAQRLHAINGGRQFVTDGHPFMTKGGWKAMDVRTAELSNPGLVVGQLQVGDLLVTDSGERAISTIEVATASPETQLYNFATSGNRTFFVRDGETAYLVHNK